MNRLPHARAVESVADFLEGGNHSPTLLPHHEVFVKHEGKISKLTITPKKGFLYKASIPSGYEDEMRKLLEYACGRVDNSITGWDYHATYFPAGKSWIVHFGSEDVIRELKQEELGGMPMHPPEPEEPVEIKHEEAPLARVVEVPLERRLDNMRLTEKKDGGHPPEQAADYISQELHGLLPPHYNTEIERDEDGTHYLRIKPKWWAFLVKEKYEPEQILTLLKEKIVSTGKQGFGTHVAEKDLRMEEEGENKWSSHITPEPNGGWTVTFGGIKRIKELKER